MFHMRSTRKTSQMSYIKYKRKKQNKQKWARLVALGSSRRMKLAAATTMMRDAAAVASAAATAGQLVMSKSRARTIIKQQLKISLNWHGEWKVQLRLSLGNSLLMAINIRHTHICECVLQLGEGFVWQAFGCPTSKAVPGHVQDHVMWLLPSFCGCVARNRSNQNDFVKWLTASCLLPAACCMQHAV